MSASAAAAGSNDTAVNSIDRELVCGGRITINKFKIKKIKIYFFEEMQY